MIPVEGSFLSLQWLYVLLISLLQLVISNFVGRPEDIFIKTLIKKTHKQRMATKTKFRQKYDLVSNDKKKWLSIGASNFCLCSLVAWLFWV